MRVTNKTLVNTFLTNLNTNLNNMKKYQDQMSSGKEIRRPSDDPYAVVRSMELNTAIERNNQYLRNIQDSSGWLDTTDTAIGQIGDSLNRIRVLMLSSANGTNTQTELDANRKEIEQKIEEIVQAGNTVFDGKYIFAGNDTITTPFSGDGNGKITMKVTDNGPINREIAPGVTIKINTTIDSIMNTTYKNADGTMEEINLADTLLKIKEALENGDKTAVGGELLGKITANIDNVLKCRGEVGAKQNRMDSAKTKNEEETFNTIEILSSIEDIDLAEKVMQYKVMESVYQASLSTNAKILMPSLVDFLR